VTSEQLIAIGSVSIENDYQAFRAAWYATRCESSEQPAQIAPSCC
jgi:hypothetical protein